MTEKVSDEREMKCGRCGHGSSCHTVAAGGCNVDTWNNENEVCACEQFQWAPGQYVENAVKSETVSPANAELALEIIATLRPTDPASWGANVPYVLNALERNGLSSQAIAAAAKDAARKVVFSMDRLPTSTVVDKVAAIISAELEKARTK